MKSGRQCKRCRQVLSKDECDVCDYCLEELERDIRKQMGLSDEKDDGISMEDVPLRSSLCPGGEGFVISLPKNHRSGAD